MAVSAVILDVDGTIASCPYDFDAIRAVVEQTAATWGYRSAHARLSGIIERIEAIAAELGNEGAGFREEAYRAVVALEISGARADCLLPGAAEALAHLRRHGILLGLITRNCRAATETVLSGFDAYDLVLTRDDVPRPKPDPDHVLRALTAFHCPPTRAAVAGDHTFDMQAGRAAGVGFCIGVRTGSSSDQSLLAAGADVVIGSVADLPEWLLSARRPTR